MPAIKFDFPKLKEEKNYSTWSIRGKAHLICAGYIKSLEDIVEQVTPPDPPEDSSASLSSNGTPTPVFHAKAPEEDRVEKDQKGLATLKLIVEDGPLSHIKRAKTLGEAWLILKNQYDKEDFSAIFVVIKKFIRIKYLKTKVGPFLNEIWTLVNDLEAKGVNLPETFVNAWVLERLDKLYDDFKTSIYSTLRDNANTYTLEQLSSHIMDESRRRQSMSDSSEEESALVTSNKRKWKNKSAKGRWCDQCELPFHNTDKCWILHTNLRPAKKARVEKVNNTDNADSTTKTAQPKAKEPKEKAMVAISTGSSEVSAGSLASDSSLLDLDFNLDTSLPQALVFDQAYPTMDMDIEEVIT